MKTRLAAIIIILCILCTGCASETDDHYEKWGRFWDKEYHDYQEIYDVEKIRTFATEFPYAPPGFVMPESLRSLGEFDDYIWISSNFYNYSYRLVDANGFRYHLRIGHTFLIRDEYNRFIEYPDVDIGDANGSLMYVNNSRHVKMLLNDVLYIYWDGELERIMWHWGDIYFEIYFTFLEKPYPLDGRRTFITKITSLSEYERTMAIKELLTDYRLYN